MMTIILPSCRTDSELQQNVTEKTPETLAVINKLALDVEDLDQTDASKVAMIYNRGNNTRSRSAKTVKNVITIADDKGEPCIYAVNFNEDGYLLVSATTRFYPVLADVERGEYTDTMPETGQRIVIDGMLRNIRLAKEDKYDFNCQPLWSRYLESEKPDFSTRTSSDYNEEFNNWYASQAYGDYRIRKLTDCRGILPDNVYAEFVSAAQTEDLWEGTQYSWQNTAYVVERTTEKVTEIGPLLRTRWAQDRSFNTSGYEALGCVTVATGQIMRFFKQPTSFDWDSMPDTYGNETLATFLAQLRSELGVSSGGSATDGDAVRVLKSYGYQVSHKDHSASEVYSYLRNRRKPIYASGQRSDNITTGHAWVIDGLYHHEVEASYTLYRLSDVWYPDFKYDKAEAASPWINYSDVSTYHMNWGWRGAHDGWFQDDRIEITNSSGEKINYSKLRKEIYVNNY